MGACTDAYHEIGYDPNRPWFSPKGDLYRPNGNPAFLSCRFAMQDFDLFSTKQLKAEKHYRNISQKGPFRPFFLG